MAKVAKEGEAEAFGFIGSPRRLYKELYQAYSDSSGNNNRVYNQIIFFILIKIVDPHLFHV